MIGFRIIVEINSSNEQSLVCMAPCFYYIYIFRNVHIKIEGSILHLVPLTTIYDSSSGKHQVFTLKCHLELIFLLALALFIWN